MQLTGRRPDETASALAWIAAASLPVTALEEAATIRLALDACARTLAGKPAAATTQRRKRAVFRNAVSYAVELRLLDANPVDRIGWKAPAVAQTVDRRLVAGPVLVAGLLAAVRGHSDRGEHLEAFYGCLYYAYLRPSEAVMLKETDCRLPRRGWGRIDLAASAARAGKDWTDDGTARQQRGLKHRAACRWWPSPCVRMSVGPVPGVPALPAERWSTRSTWKVHQGSTAGAWGLLCRLCA